VRKLSQLESTGRLTTDSGTLLKSTRAFSFFVALIIWMLSTGSAYSISVVDAYLIQKGFQVFNTQTFGGNGRTCETCHLPQSDFTISPSDLPTLNAHQQQLVFGVGIRGGNAGQAALENPQIVRDLLLFNINEGVGGLTSEVGTALNPAGPFRASMSIGGLAFTTANLLPDFCASNSPPSLFASGLLSVCPSGVADFPASASPILLVNVFLGTEPPTFGNDPGPGVDEGTRNVELGWAGDGAVTDPNIFGTTTNADNSDCKEAVNEALADPTDLTKTLRVFSLTAVKTHLTRTLNREPGIDFRCPTPDELDQMAAFQKYLGRQFELALKAGVPDDTDDGANALNNFADGTQIDSSQPVITFKDSIAETGKAIYLDGHAQCNLCHFNAGVNDIIGEIDAPSANDPSAPFPGRNFTSHQLTDLLRCTDKTGQPTTCLNGVTATTHGLNALITPVVLPQDPGDKVQAGGVSSSGGTDCGNGINSEAISVVLARKGCGPAASMSSRSSKRRGKNPSSTTAPSRRMLKMLRPSTFHLRQIGSPRSSRRETLAPARAHRLSQYLPIPTSRTPQTAKTSLTPWAFFFAH
jgi:hypothetical protein